MGDGCEGEVLEERREEETEKARREGAAGRGMEEEGGGSGRMLSAQCDRIIRSVLALQGKQSLPGGSRSCLRKYSDQSDCSRYLENLSKVHISYFSTAVIKTHGHGNLQKVFFGCWFQRDKSSSCQGDTAANDVTTRAELSAHILNTAPRVSGEAECGGAHL